MHNIIAILEIKKYMKQNSQDKIIKKKATEITYDIYLNLHLLIFSNTGIIIVYEN